MLLEQVIRVHSEPVQSEGAALSSIARVAW